jgi:chemotaxis protein histidine kinase CheA
MKKSKEEKSKDEILVVEAEEMLPETPLEKVIEDKLVKANITDLVIDQLKEKYGNMKLESVDDKSGYLDIKEARKIVRKVGIITEDLCKRGRESAVREQRLWLSKQNEILDKIAKVQDPLDEEIKKFEDELERKENEAKQKREEAFIAKQSQLLKYGAEYKNGSYELGHISYELELLKNCEEDTWNDTILPKYRKVFEEKEAERVAEENKRKEEADKLKAEQEKFAEQQRLFREQQEEFAKQQKALQEQKDAADKIERDRKLQEQREIDSANEKKWRDRLSKLNNIGWNGQFAFAKWDDETPVLTYEELIGLSDDVFSECSKNYNAKALEVAKEAEEKKQAEIEKQKQEAIAKALADQKEAEEKRQRDIQEQIRQDAIKKQAELDAANDRTKYQDTVAHILKTPIHTMASPFYKNKMGIIADFIDGLKN